MAKKKKKKERIRGSSFLNMRSRKRLFVSEENGEVHVVDNEKGLNTGYYKVLCGKTNVKTHSGSKQFFPEFVMPHYAGIRLCAECRRKSS